jgi:hypothetical protein
MEDTPESFEAFKKSFYYGSRSDMNFKFLADMSDEEAGAFFQKLLWKMGDALNDGDFSRVTEHIIRAQARVYNQPGRFVYEDAPFCTLRAPLTQLRLGLMSSSGHFVEGDDPQPFGIENMSQQEAEARIMDFIKTDAQLSTIPMNTPTGKLRTRHGGYDVRGSQADPNTNFPLDRLRELQAEGALGELAENAYSFIGATSQLKLRNQIAPVWLEQFKAEGIDALLLVPV